ncbi:hypothetical protein EYF80_021331 [Liparis tanakae]|uniref:Uncharacterized protein n=1 Tax=Liparis tanakae TaxID=230148 RepID=A0A4Z2HS00_9TELE|nr:hypothetical protein EYF80_021331 [Liparis tanakae]
MMSDMKCICLMSPHVSGGPEGNLTGSKFRHREVRKRSRCLLSETYFNSHNVLNCLSTTVYT